MPTGDKALPVGDPARPPSIAELERLAKAGDGAAASLLGDHYREGDAVSQDSDLAFRWYSRGADLGDRHAQNNLGSMFLNGLGCERDPARAIDCYRKSAEQGLAIAQYNLAKRYYGGDGIDQDYAEARNWFEKASVQGETWASCELGTMHRFGQGVQRNLLAAAEFHLIAAEAGDDVAILGNIAEYHAELEEMALSGSQLASLFLSRIYNRGFGVDKSQPMTWAWISCAKKYGESDVYPDTAQEVDEAYAFYHMSITSENRKEGQKRLKDMRAAHTKRLRKQP
jgi:TPR repeat protein